MSGEVENQWDAKRGVMLGMQAFVYGLFVLIGAVWIGLSASGQSGEGAFIAVTPAAFAPVAVLIAAVLVAFHVFWPFRATMIDRAIGLIAGVLSLVGVSLPLLSIVEPGGDGDADPLKLRAYPMASWAATVAGLLVVLTIVSFARQMLRAERSHLIRALSHCVTGGAASISLAGWAFMPYIGATRPSMGVGTGVYVGVIVVMVLFALVLGTASVWWLKELDPAPEDRSPWIGVALLPVMFYGLVVFAAALFLQLI